MPFEGAFLEIAAILTIATLLGLAGWKLKQPLLIMFLAAGILAGPAGLGIVSSHKQIELLANMGIAFLLFIVGLKLDLGLIRTIGPVALATGIGQIVFTSAVGFGIALAMGMQTINAAYVSVALTFSSTIIIVKLLSDKKEIDSLHGQIAVGFLIVQDIAAILALVGLTTLGSAPAQGVSVFMSAAIVLIKGIGMLAVTGILMKWVLPAFVERLAHSQELLLLFAISWAVCLGAGAELLGFTKEVGAFLAGVSLASTGYRDAIGSRLSSIRDFLLLFFFIDLGARLDWSTVGGQILPSAVFSIFVLVGNPLIVLIIMGAMGYRRRTSFLAGLTVAQISEFSLIVAALGLSLGHIDKETMGLITLVGVATIFASTYMILYSGSLYKMLSGMLKIFERRNPYRESEIGSGDDERPADVVLVGLGNYGSGLAEYLLRRNMIVTGVDFDPSALKRWRTRGMRVVYGDMSDPDVYEQLCARKPGWVVSSVRSRELNLALLRHLQNRGYDGKIAVTASTQREAEFYESAGVRIVFKPYADAAEQAADSLTHAMDLLPPDVDWPVAFSEVRIRSEASAAGKTLRELPLQEAAGVSVLAVSRAGLINYDPGPDFQVYPGDRLIMTGPPDGLHEAELLLNRLDIRQAPGDSDRFELAEIRVAGDSAISGKTIADINFRKNFGATLIGIRRGEEEITAILPQQSLFGGDLLIVIGTAAQVDALKAMEPL